MAGMREAGMLKRWTWRGEPLGTPRDWGALARALGLHPLLGRLLVQRDLGRPDDAEAFLKPKLTSLHDPVLLPGVAQAVERILQALDTGQPIVIYGDYDVDGITASAILWHCLKALGTEARIYVPHRIEEGYGLNPQALGELALDRPLIITVDCGITAVEPARVARAAGADLIITDHHEFDPLALPDVHTIVHPRLENEGQGPYPFGDLCGAGVAFKIAWHLLRVRHGAERLPEDWRRLLLDLVSLAALGTVADVVPLVQENRTITAFGLAHVRRTRFVGLGALIEASGIADQRIDAYHVGFVLGPRLNACGRMGHARDAVTLLTTADAGDAARIARFLTRENQRRRDTERQILEEARQMVLENGYDAADSRAIVVGKAGWHPGVVGIVASRLVDEFARPVVMLNIDAQRQEAAGSARSVLGVSIHEALEHCARHFQSWGGHAMAAGLRMDPSSVDAFRRDLVEFVNQRLGVEDLVGGIQIDAECRLEDLSFNLCEQVARLSPFGRGNPAPILCARGVRLERPPVRMGREGRHLRLLVRQGAKLSEAVGFHMGALSERLGTAVELDVAFEPKISTWQGRSRVQLQLKDMRFSGQGATEGRA